jgi:hypothetical protein
MPTSDNNDDGVPATNRASFKSVEGNADVVSDCSERKSRKSSVYDWGNHSFDDIWQSSRNRDPSALNTTSRRGQRGVTDSGENVVKEEVQLNKEALKKNTL